MRGKEPPSSINEADEFLTDNVRSNDISPLEQKPDDMK